MKRFQISVKGIVQGVGFRPFIYKLASDLKLRGFVKNTSDGVTIEVEGGATDEFVRSLQSKHPPLAKIDNIDVKELPFKGHKDFAIIDSADTGSFTLVPPDISICNDCKDEMFDPSNRRYLYPFINCTNCGPRYSITRGVPYDRPNTTMSVFNMCPECLSEYHNPTDRRFHAQPNACTKCGPSLELRIANYELGISGKDPIEETIKLLQQGAIVAIKGLGGFHLCCDASNEEAVRRLREKKRKSNKPFALMSHDVETIRNYCEVSEAEKALLESSRRPVVLLKKIKEGPLSCEIAPNNKYLGFMLPYTPLHYLLFRFPSLTRNCFNALVMTSANLAEEPIVIGNDEAISKLSGIADAFLLHNRDIFMRVDDSVVKADALTRRHGDTETRRQGDLDATFSPRHRVSASPVPLSFIRRSRGYVPEPVVLGEDGPDVLGCGADIKNTFTITKGVYAIPSQHIGDMENIETLRFFEESLSNLKKVYRSNPLAIGHDLHPGYLSTQWALRQQAPTEGAEAENKIRAYGVQHHHAHIASVMAEHALKEKVIGIAFDGTGYGTDGNIWGSEFLLCDPGVFSRLAHFRYIPLPGGEMAVKECWRTAISYLASCYGDIGPNYDLIMKGLGSIGFIEKYGRNRIDNILKLINKRQFSPISSGAGRLFDAVSALTGICDFNSYEGEAAIALENAIQGAETTDAYQYEISDPAVNAQINQSTHSPVIIDFTKMVLAIMKDIQQGKNKWVIALSFHNTLINAITDVAGRISDKNGIKVAALSGGVFQNEYLLKGAFDRLVTTGFKVYTNEKVPCNDAGISLGQAYILRKLLK